MITEGPWSAEPHEFGGCWWVKTKDGIIQVAIDNYEANALAIAAVPEMLETLEWILDGGWNDGPGSWANLERRVEAVIAKARGEA